MPDLLNYITAGGIVGLLGLMLKLSRDTRTEQDKKISNVYRRFDENKEHVENKFIITQVCDERHKRIDESLTRIEDNIKFLVQKNGGNK